MFKSYSDLSFFGKLFYRFKFRKFLRQFKIACKYQSFIEFCPRLDSDTIDYINKYFTHCSVTYDK